MADAGPASREDAANNREDNFTAGRGRWVLRSAQNGTIVRYTSVPVILDAVKDPAAYHAGSRFASTRRLAGAVAPCGFLPLPRGRRDAQARVAAFRESDEFAGHGFKPIA